MFSYNKLRFIFIYFFIRQDYDFVLKKKYERPFRLILETDNGPVTHTWDRELGSTDPILMSALGFRYRFVNDT